MRNKFTKQAQTALTLAKAAAIDFELGYIGTEHLLLGLLSETEAVSYTHLTLPTTSRV